MDAFFNRLIKNEREMGRVARRVGTSCYRVYDRDIPEYPFVVERLGPALLVGSFARDLEMAQTVFESQDAFAEIFDVDRKLVTFRERVRQKGLQQYNRLDDEPLLVVAKEHDLNFQLNLSQYLDVGLFCDHRKTRFALRSIAKGLHCLNLFCYTGSVSVYLAAGGARSVHSMDMSRTYIDWAKANFELNQMPVKAHLFDQQDVTAWLRDARGAGSYDLIFLDPPSFSNSKRMEGSFDVQRDHEWLLNRVISHLSPKGILIFSTNLSSFRMAFDPPGGMFLEDITALTQSRDFRRRSAHKSFLIGGHLGAKDEFLSALRKCGPDF